MDIRTYRTEPESIWHYQIHTSRMLTASLTALDTENSLFKSSCSTPHSILICTRNRVLIYKYSLTRQADIAKQTDSITKKRMSYPKTNTTHIRLIHQINPQIHTSLLISEHWTNQ